MAGGLTFGADPEFVIAKLISQKEFSEGSDKKTKLDVVSAIHVLKGHNKDNKLPVSEGQFAFYDNVLIEFNVLPAYTFNEFSENFKKCLAFSEGLLEKQNLTLLQLASTKFPIGECKDEEAQHFGCEPEFNIYLKDDEGRVQMVEPPVMEPGNTFRSCGGHIHIGHPIATVERGNPPKVVKLMDIFVGATSLLLDHDPSSEARRKIYGGAGTHRVANYGLEYRTLSNFWFASPHIAEIIYRLTRLAVQLSVAAPVVADNLIMDAALQELINSGDKKAAEKLFKKTQDLMSDDLTDKIMTWRRASMRPATLGEEWGLTPQLKKVKVA